jgi:hypothetical protein
MSAAEITALALAAGGMLATLLTFISSARNTDLEAIKAIVRSQQDQIASLQKELRDERAYSTGQDRIIEQLRRDLNAAHRQIRELQGHA